MRLRAAISLLASMAIAGAVVLFGFALSVLQAAPEPRFTCEQVRQAVRSFGLVAVEAMGKAYGASPKERAFARKCMAPPKPKQFLKYCFVPNKGYAPCMHLDAQRAA